MGDDTPDEERFDRLWREHAGAVLAYARHQPLGPAHAVASPSGPAYGTTGDVERLAAIRMAVDTRRDAAAGRTAERRHDRRRLAVLAGLTTTAVAVAVAVPRLGTEPDRRIDAAIAADGSMNCTGSFESHSDPIRPDEAAVRLFPTVIPAGWRLVNIFARKATAPAACTTPSLMAADLDEGDVMRAGVWVTGPVDQVGFGNVEPVPTGVADILNGRPAVRYQSPDSYSWLWSDDRGKQWHATVGGYPLDEAKKALAALSTDGDRVVWSTSVSPELRVLHQRTGPRYRAEVPTEAWHIRLTDGRRERIVYVDTGLLPPLVTSLTVGERLGELAGHPEIEWPGMLNYEPLPGTRADSEVLGDAAAVRELLAGLRQLPADDPRLDQYAMPE